MKLTKVVKWSAAFVLVGTVAAFSLMSVNAGLSNSSKFLGNIVGSYAPSNFSAYWNQVTSENGGKWGSVESSRDRMDWTQADTAYNYAKSNGFQYKFHTLIWGSQQPGWITSLSSNAQKEEVLEWMDAVAAKYGDADFVDVVNEPLHAPPAYKNAIGGNGSSGWDWVIWSFREARKRFSGKLLINEYGIISDPNAASNYLTIIKLLQAQNLIDGIGIQCHQFNVDNASNSTMKTVLDRLAATGLPIYVSELDITGDDRTQLERYKAKFPVLWEHASVKGITLWGWKQGECWKDGTYLLNSSGSERPALTWLKEYFGSLASASPTVSASATPSPSPSASASPSASPSQSSTTTATPSPSASSGGCTVAYSMYDWGTGATVNIAIKNDGSTAIDGWKLEFSFPGDQKITNLWNGSYAQSGMAVTITNAAYNGMITAGGTTTLGFNISYSGSNAEPTSFTLNGTACRVQ
jgi:endo-1,4-beta-xylanase